MIFQSLSGTVNGCHAGACLRETSLIAPLSVLSMSGSLRRTSLNGALLDMAVECAPGDTIVIRYGRIGDLPLFNPDLELQRQESVLDLRDRIAKADAILIASPEYAHGISGVMKNALDWMVSTGVFVEKPVALWNASPRSSIALGALRETLRVMAARLVEEAALSLLISPFDEGSLPRNPDPMAMRRALASLVDAARSVHTVGSLAGLLQVP